MEFKSIKDQMRPILHLTDKEIAFKLGCGERTVEDRRRKIGYESGDGSSSRHIWPDEDIALATKLWLGGFSGSEISDRFDGRYSRSAVIVKMSREGVKSPRKRGDSTQAQVLARKKCKPRIVVSNPAGPPMRPTPIPQPQAADVARVSFMDLEDNHCRFIVGDPVGPTVKQFCGDERMTGSAYCNGHHHRCFDPLRRRPSYTPPTYGVSIGLGALNAVKEFETV